MRSHLSELTVAFTDLRASTMTTEQLDTADAFFRTPTGRRTVAVQVVALGRAWSEHVARGVLSSQRDALRKQGVSP